MSDIYWASPKVPICRLEIKKHFESLTPKQRLYAHYICRASWWGTRIVLRQVSTESEVIYNLILALFPAKDDYAGLKQKSGVSDEEYQQFLFYLAQFLGNLGNYKSFGDSKFIPRIPRATFEKIVYASGKEKAISLAHQCCDLIYALVPESLLLLGFPPDHTTTYYTTNVTKEEIDIVQRFVEEKKLSAYNTRLTKSEQEVLTLRIASAELKPQAKIQFEGRQIILEYGDHAIEMRHIADELKQAIPHAGNDHQKKMLEKYVESFSTGSIEAHKDSQRHWIKDVGPSVESNIGFIESYRDPAGVRAEWEGFAAVVNKEQTKKFESLVNHAPDFIAKLPWPADFEKDKFNRPDFTSLEVLAFCTSGIPAGINIPNYDDIRQIDGFKNVSLGNILNAEAPGEIINFLDDVDLKLFTKYRGPSFEIQVGIHELLGHGSGKLLEQNHDGSNFDVKHPPVNPITNAPVELWYKNGETYPSKFGNLASSFEECRAECCGIYLSTDPFVLKIFGHEGQEADDVMYINWLQMARAGLQALEFYDIKTQNWGQPHMKARFAILQVMLKAGQSFVTIEPSADMNDVIVRLDREKIMNVGKPAIGDFLQRLQIFKATADVTRASKLFTELTTPPSDWFKLRDIVIEKRQPRKIFVQPNTVVNSEGQVVLKEYEATPEGLIQSFIERGV